MTDRVRISGKFDISVVFSAARETIGSNFGLFFVAALVLSGVPSFVAYWWQAQYLEVMRSDPQGFMALFGSSDFWMPVLIGGLVAGLAGAALQGILTSASLKHLRGETPGFADSVESGIARLLPIFALELIIGIGTALGALLLIVPGVIFAICCMVAVPAYVDGRVGFGDAIGGSFDLTRGHRGYIFVMALVVGVAFWLLGLVLGMLTGGDARSPLMAGLAGGFTATLSSMVWIALRTATYVALRTDKEGDAPDELETVFS